MNPGDATYTPGYKRYVTGVLLAVYIFNQTDRAVFGFLMEPIKRELSLSDTQLGFLGGPALVICYTLLGIPIARWADRSSRVNIISLAVAVWSGVVTLSAAVGTFWQFAWARVGVGVGEAGFTAVAQSLLSDYHPGRDRTRAMSIFMLGMPLGAALSSLLAGWINQAFGWRAVFLAAGIPGLALSLLVKASVKEPVRLATAGAGRAEAESARPSLRAVFGAIWRRRSLKHLAIAQGLVNILSCFMAWFPVFFMRSHQLSSGELGTWLALTVGLGGATGIWLGGYLTTRYGANDERMKVRLMAVATAFITPTACLALWWPSAYVALLLLFPFKALLYFSYAPTFSFVQTISASGMRATVAAVFILIQVLAGGILGIQMLGILSDILTPILGSSGAALRWGMTFASPLGLWAAVHFWLAGRSIHADVQGRPPVVSAVLSST